MLNFFNFFFCASWTKHFVTHVLSVIRLNLGTFVMAGSGPASTFQDQPLSLHRAFLSSESNQNIDDSLQQVINNIKQPLLFMCPVF